MKSKLTSHLLIQRSIHISLGNITGSLNTHCLVTHRKSPEVFLVKEPGPLGTASDTVITSKPTLNDLQPQHNTVDHECHSPDRTTFPVAQHATHELLTSHSTQQVIPETIFPANLTTGAKQRAAWGRVIVSIPIHPRSPSSPSPTIPVETRGHYVRIFTNL